VSIATLGGAPPGTAAVLGLSMLGIQVSIGALNDWADAARDAGAKPAKPIPSGLTTRRAAVALAGVAGAVGVALSAAVGPAPGLVIALALGLGVVYDLRLSRTVLSWLPLAMALPLVPIHAWLGATGQVPAGMALLYPAAVAAGAALALANGLVDLERDAHSGRPTVAVALGASGAWLANLVLLAVAGTAAVTLAPEVPPGPYDGVLTAEVLRGLRTWGVALGILALGLGAAALRAHRPAIRERGWELQAVGVGAVGIGWLAGIAAAA
jgi:4-hydroxybenzoate polyprenyltransferase